MASRRLPKSGENRAGFSSDSTAIVAMNLVSWRVIPDDPYQRQHPELTSPAKEEVQNEYAARIGVPTRQCD